MNASPATHERAFANRPDVSTVTIHGGTSFVRVYQDAARKIFRDREVNSAE